MRAAPLLRAGDTPESRRIGPVTATDIVRFAGAGGDFNPLHHDPAAAQAAGFPGVIAMGQYTAGLLAALLSDWVGIENLREFEVRFMSPVFAGDVIEVTAEVTAVERDFAQLSLAARAGDRVVVTATAEVASR